MNQPYKLDRSLLAAGASSWELTSAMEIDTKSKLIQKFSFQPVDLYIALIDMGKIIRHKMAPLTSGLIMSKRYRLSSFVTTMLLISSVLVTPMTQPTPLKMTSEIYEYRVGLMSPISI